jgi:predicted nucleic acid-binding protein
LTHTLQPLFEGRIVAISEDVLLRWRQIVEAGRKRVLIAAAAQVERLVIVSRDVREFVEARVPVLNPWTAMLWSPGRPERLLEALDRTDLLEAIGRS